MRPCSRRSIRSWTMRRSRSWCISKSFPSACRSPWLARCNKSQVLTASALMAVHPNTNCALASFLHPKTDLLPLLLLASGRNEGKSREWTRRPRTRQAHLPKQLGMRRSLPQQPVGQTNGCDYCISAHREPAKGQGLVVGLLLMLIAIRKQKEMRSPSSGIISLSRSTSLRLASTRLRWPSASLRSLVRRERLKCWPRNSRLR